MSHAIATFSLVSQESLFLRDIKYVAGEDDVHRCEARVVDPEVACEKHSDVKNFSFDTALGYHLYHLYHLLTAGIAAATETVKASSHPDRDRSLGGPKSWAHQAARLGEREASCLFMTEWAAGEPEPATHSTHCNSTSPSSATSPKP
ncbi:hypothetical protein [Streptomyces sp. NPDC051452]|uniref:hypothetical protein n=1 Tax=Streptomyces sp. NPDC051452 TaxID=3365654 RepID=UPI0037A92B06